MSQFESKGGLPKIKKQPTKQESSKLVDKNFVLNVDSETESVNNG